MEEAGRKLKAPDRARPGERVSVKWGVRGAPVEEPVAAPAAAHPPSFNQFRENCVRTRKRDPCGLSPGPRSPTGTQGYLPRETT